jgi:LemA protein
MPYIIGGIVLLVVLWGVGGYNGLITLRNLKDEAFATMDVYMKKRYDLIPNLVETVKGYASHEKETFEKVVAARSAAMGAQSLEERAQGENLLTGTLKSLFALAENYPELKANTNFMDLQQQLQKVEEDIAQSRKYYNAVVKDYNTRTELFPTSILANMFGFKKGPYFEIETGERENVRVSF